MSKITSSRRVTAFTLVELLVVIGIIAVLIAILLPALGAARRQAQLAQCLSIERQIAVAAQQHAIAHQGFYPVAGFLAFGADTNADKSSPALLGDPGRRRYSYSNVDNVDILAAWHAAVAQYMGKKRSLNGGTDPEIKDQEYGRDAYLKYFTCPSHTLTNSDLLESFIYVGQGVNIAWSVRQSYVINESVFGINDGLGYLRGNSAKIRRPADTMMLSDGLPTLSLRQAAGLGYRGVKGWVTWCHNVAPSATNMPMTLGDTSVSVSGGGPVIGGTARTKVSDVVSFDKLRHKGKINIVYFDGHAETRTIRDSDLKPVLLLAK